MPLFSTKFICQTSCILLGLECLYVLTHHDGNVMANFKPGDYMRKILIQSVTQAAWKKKSEFFRSNLLPSGY